MKLVFHLPEGKIEEFSTDKNSVSVGRGNTCDIVLPYEGFSRRHAQLELINGEIFVTDLGSTNGVHIDGQKIPVSERTPMQSYLNLQIGPAHQIEIIDDAVSMPVAGGLSPARSESVRARAQQPTDVREHTKTTRLDPRLIKKNDNKKDNGNEKSKLKLLLAPALIIGISVFYYMNTGSEEAATTTAGSEVASAPVVPLKETSFLTNSMIASLDKDKSCAGDKAKQCMEAGIVEANQEGVVLEGKSLIIYMNMTPLAQDKYADNVESLSQKDRLEILILRRIFNSSLVKTLSRQTTIDNIQVVGGVVEQDGWKLKVAVKIRRDIDPKKSEKFFMFGLFDQILNQGQVDKMSQISSIYEKLTIE